MLSPEENEKLTRVEGQVEWRPPCAACGVHWLP
jgi:hypothetical protein